MPDGERWRERDRAILGLMAQGLSDRAIAIRLQLSPETIRWYNKQLYDRLAVTNRTQAVARAGELGLIDAPTLARPLSPPTRSPIRYVDRDGVSIAWQTIGTGSVDLLFIHGFVSHLELAWEDPEFTSFFQQLGRAMRVILFDKRGVGLSDRVQGGPSLEETIGDALAVLDAAGSPRAFAFGTSEGGAAAILLASMYPDRIGGLILNGATAMVATRTEEPSWARPWPRLSDRIARLVSTWGDPWALDQFAPTRAGEPAFRDWWSRVLRAASSPASIRQVLECAGAIDVRALLPSVPLPTLVVHRTGDRVVPVEAGRYLAEHLPGASLLELPGQDHIYFVQSEPLVRAMIQFVQTPGQPAEPESRIAILLSAAEPLARLSAECQRVIEANGGRHLQATARGWAACFDSPSAAVRTAARLSRREGRSPLGLALHVGASRASDGRPLAGVARVLDELSAAAPAGRVLLSGTLHDILAGTGVVASPAGSPPTAWMLAMEP